MLNDNNRLPPNSLRVLIVDDDTDSCELLLLTLEPYTIEAQVAFSAHEALDVLNQFQPDVLISDIAMPYEDGCSLIRKVRQLKTVQRSTPAIAITALARDELRKQALSSGFNRWLTKPFDPSDLIGTIATLMEQAAAT